MQLFNIFNKSVFIRKNDSFICPNPLVDTYEGRVRIEESQLSKLFVFS